MSARFWRPIEQADISHLLGVVTEVANELFELWRDDPGESEARDWAEQLYLATFNESGCEAIYGLDHLRANGGRHLRAAPTAPDDKGGRVTS